LFQRDPVVTNNFLKKTLAKVKVAQCVDVHGRCEPQVACHGTRWLLWDWRKLAVGGRGALFWLLFWASKKVTKDCRDSGI